MRCWQPTVGLSASTLSDPGLFRCQRHPSLGSGPSERRPCPGWGRATAGAALHPCACTHHHNGDEYTKVIKFQGLFKISFCLFYVLFFCPSTFHWSDAYYWSKTTMKLLDWTLRWAFVTAPAQSLSHRPVSISWVIGSTVSSCYGVMLCLWTHSRTI